MEGRGQCHTHLAAPTALTALLSGSSLQIACKALRGNGGNGRVGAGGGGVGNKVPDPPHAPKSPGTPLEGTTDPPTDKTLLFRG